MKAGGGNETQCFGVRTPSVRPHPSVPSFFSLPSSSFLFIFIVLLLFLLLVVSYFSSSSISFPFTFTLTPTRFYLLFSELDNTITPESLVGLRSGNIRMHDV